LVSLPTEKIPKSAAEPTLLAVLILLKSVALQFGHLMPVVMG
jgi:hypothetical protein